MAVREVAKAVENLIAVCNESCTNEELMIQLKEAAANVSHTLNDLLNHIKHGIFLILNCISFLMIIHKTKPFFISINYYSFTKKI